MAGPRGRAGRDGAGRGGRVLVEGPRRRLERRSRPRTRRREQVTTRPADEPETTTTTTLPPYDGWVNPASSQDAVDAKTVERPAHLPRQPHPLLLRPGPGADRPRRCCGRTRRAAAMCGKSSDGGVTSRPGAATAGPANPNVFERDGKTWVSFGAYDYGLHWLDADNGDELREDLQDRRHRQGLDDHRSRRLPAQLQGLARQQLLRRGHRPRRHRPRSCGS